MNTKILLASVMVASFAIAGCAHDKEMAAEESMAKEEMASEEMATEEMATEEMATEPMVAEEASTNPAADACYENGGSLVQWTDADGESIDACRTSDGAEYSLDDYLTYGLPSEPAEG